MSIAPFFEQRAGTKVGHWSSESYHVGSWGASDLVAGIGFGAFRTPACGKRLRIPRLMKNANIFVDVDLTLVDANGKLLPGAREGLIALKQAGCHLFLWSTVGPEYCRKVAECYRLTELFEGFTAKPDIIVDDMPSTCVSPFAYSLQESASWPELAARIIKKHVDK